MKPHSRSLAARLWRALSRAVGAALRPERRSAFGRELFFRLARRLTPAVAIESHGLRYLVSTDDHGVGMTLFMGEDLERGTLRNALRALEESGAERPAGTLVDVGAHVGTTTVTALGAFGFERAICFEPSPRNRDLLRANLAYNDLGERATVVPVALSDRAGSAVFEVAPMNPSDGRIRTSPQAPAGGAYGEEGWSTIEVETRSFDSFVESGELDLAAVGLVWIDAQGHEGQILAGARTLLASRTPVVIEFWPYALRRAEGLDPLLETVAASFRSFLDLGDCEAGGRPRPTADLAAFAAGDWGVKHTDLLLVP